MYETNTPRAVVITDSRAHRSDGAVVDLADGTTLAWILGRLASPLTPQCTIVIDGHDERWLAGQLDAVKADGWKPATTGPWSLFRNGDRTVSVGLRHAMHPAHHFGVLVNADTDPGVLAMRLDRYQRVTGTAWRGTPALTAHNGIRLSWENSTRQPLWHEQRLPGYKGAGHITWQRNLTDDEREWGWLHTFDGNAAYLGAAISADLPWSALEPNGQRWFDPALAGVWRIRPSRRLVDLHADPIRPPLFGNRRNGDPGLERDGTFTCTTPYAKLLAWLNDGEDLDVVDSATAQAGHGHASGARILRNWGEQIRDGLTLVRATTSGPLVTAVQRTYKDAVGGFQRDRMPITRHVWGWTTIDGWRATIYRTAVRVHETQGVWPVRIATDSLTYADCTPTPAAPADRRFTALTEALGVAICAGDCGCAPANAVAKLGQWKHEQTQTTAQWEGNPHA